eukprot:GAFH01002133.1.p1 GENE.GAFH01002133.1~~GAFH01002133.1.p1  ORF type:complete len:405 (-),score=125.07 GAFH01002133.1:63-1253(-)
MEKQMPGYKPELVPEGTDLREARILELAKKNRGLMVSFQRERDKAASLSKICKQLQGELKAIKESDPSAAPSAQATEAVSVEQDYKDKLAQANARVADRQHQIQALKNDLARHQRALLREVGDVPLAKVLEEGTGGWRGRAQEISLLKSQLKELRAQPASPQAAHTPPTEEDGLPAEAGPVKDFDVEHKRIVSAADRKKVQEIEQLQRQVQDLAADLAAAKTKNASLVARTRILEQDNAQLRQRIGQVMTKTEHDSELVATQREAIGLLQKELAQAQVQAAQATQAAQAVAQQRGDSNSPPVSASSHPPSAAASRDGAGASFLGGNGESGAVTGEPSEMVLLQERQISRQEQIIRSLRAELEALQQAPLTPPLLPPGMVAAAASAAAAALAPQYHH